MPTTATSTKTMRLATAVSVVQQAVEAQIDARVRSCERDRELLLMLSRIDVSTAPRIKTALVAPPTKGPAAGTIPSRVLDIVGEFDEPTSMQDILSAKHGAKERDVIAAVRLLVRTRHLVATGGMRARRYGLPMKKGGK